MAFGLIGRMKDTMHSQLSGGYAQELMLWEGRAERHIRRNVGYVPGLLLHYWHGKKRDRRYKERWQILVGNDYDPDLDLKRDWQGLKVCGGWGRHLSEQGLTAYLLLRYSNRVGIPMPLVYNHNYDNYELGTYGGLYPHHVYLDKGIMGSLHGFHFIGANRGKHPAWEFYKQRDNSIKLL